MKTCCFAVPTHQRPLCWSLHHLGSVTDRAYLALRPTGLSVYPLYIHFIECMCSSDCRLINDNLPWRIWWKSVRSMKGLRGKLTCHLTHAGCLMSEPERISSCSWYHMSSLWQTAIAPGLLQHLQWESLLYIHSTDVEIELEEACNEIFRSEMLM